MSNRLFTLTKRTFFLRLYALTFLMLFQVGNLNAQESPKINFSATLTWTDGPETDHTGFKLNLFRESAKAGSVKEIVRGVESVISGNAPNFTHTWSGLDAKDSEGYDYTYSVVEKCVANGKVIINGNTYEVSQNGNDITNTYVAPKEGEFLAIKNWINGPKTDHNKDVLILSRISAKAGAITETVAKAAVITGDESNHLYTWSELEQKDAEGNKYTYSVAEKDVADNKVIINGNTYVVTQNKNSIINTYQAPTADFVAKKIWVNGPYEDHKEVILQFSRMITGSNAKEILSLEPTVVESLPTITYTWKDLPQTDENGIAYTYSVQEKCIADGCADGNKIKVNGNTYVVSQNGNEITNTYEVPTADFVATKTWVNGPVADHIAVPLIISRSFKNPSIVMPQVLNTMPVVTGSAPTFTYTWKDLPQTDKKGNPYKYEVEEKCISDGCAEGDIVTFNDNKYQVSQNGNDITNTYVVPKNGELIATKTWVNGPDADHIKVDLVLLRKSDKEALKEVEGAKLIVSGDAPNFIYTWSELEETDLEANKYTYSVVEKDVVNDRVTINGNTYVVSQIGNDIKNTYESPKRSFEATKTWVNGPVENQTKVELELSRISSKAGAVKEVVSIEPTISGTAPTFTYSWANIDAKDSEGNDYTYSVVEKAAINNKVTINGSIYIVDQIQNAITNTYQVPKEDFVATKIWINGPDNDHTAVDLILSRISQKAEATNEIISTLPTIIKTDEGFKYTWDKLDKTDDEGFAYTYTVVEKDVVNNTVTINGNTYKVSQVGNSITNEYVVPTLDIKVTKVWKNTKGGNTPTVELQLKQDGIVIKTHTIAANAKDAALTASWNTLPKTDVFGKEYVYTVDEKDVPNGYVKTIEGDIENGFRVVNNYDYSNSQPQHQIGVDEDNDPSTAKTITATKVWKDIIEGQATPVVTLELKGDNGKTIENAVKQIASGYKGDEFKVTWSELPKYDTDSSEITYSVTEHALPIGYVLETITGDVQSGFVVTNKYTDPNANIATIQGTTTLKGKTLENEQFEFYLTKEGETTPITTVKNDANGNFSIDLPKLDLGIHKFTVKEKDAGVAGYTYDNSVYTIEVEVTLDITTNTLKPTVTIKDAQGNVVGVTIFKNIYTAPESITVSLDGKTTLDGKDLKASDFEFYLTKEGETTPIAMVRNDANGDFPIAIPSFDSAGTYTFTVKEKDAGKAGYTYDDNVYTIVVEITLDEATNTLKPIVTIKDVQNIEVDKVLFNNTYEKPDPITITIQGITTLEGKPLEAQQFEFDLTKEGETTPTATVKNDAVGNFSIDIPNLEVGTYKYTVKEKDAGEAGYTYDNNVYTVEVEVTLDETTNTLKPTVTIKDAQGNIASVTIFKNTYTAAEPNSVNIIGKTTLTGKPLEDKEFEFELTIEGGTIPIAVIKNDANGNFPVNISNLDEGTYKYTVKEKNEGKLGYTYDSNVFTIEVVVSLDNVSNTLKSVVTITDAAGNVVNEVLFNNLFSYVNFIEEVSGMPKTICKGLTINLADYVKLTKTNDNISIVAYIKGESQALDSTNVTVLENTIYVLKAKDKNTGEEGVGIEIEIKVIQQAVLEDITLDKKELAVNESVEITALYNADADANIEWFDEMGNKVLESKSTANTSTINLTNTPKSTKGIKVYTVKLTDACSGKITEKQVEVEFYLDPTMLILQKDNFLFSVNNNTQTNGGYNFVEYQWYIIPTVGGQAELALGKTNAQNYTPNTKKKISLDMQAYYQLKVVTADGRVLRTSYFKAKQTREFKFDFKVYPNPADVNSEITVKIENLHPSEYENAEIKIYTTLGVLKQSIKVKDYETVFTISDSGVYFIQFYSEAFDGAKTIIVK